MNNRDECNEFAERVETLAALKLYSLGFKVKSNEVNDGSNTWDKLATSPNGGQLKIEVKGARLHRTKFNRNRYHARIHNGDADFIMMYCETEPPDAGSMEGMGYWFVLPTIEVWPRVDIAIWSADPTEYSGQWAQYLEN